MFLLPVLYISNTFLSIFADPSSADFWIKVIDVSIPISFKLPFNRNSTVPKAPNTIIIIKTIIIIYYYYIYHILLLLLLFLLLLLILKKVVQERYQDIIIILARMETFYSSTCTSTLLVFELLISFLNVCIFADYVK